LVSRRRGYLARKGETQCNAEKAAQRAERISWHSDSKPFRVVELRS
jgi:hypothetical protein